MRVAAECAFQCVLFQLTGGPAYRVNWPLMIDRRVKNAPCFDSVETANAREVHRGIEKLIHVVLFRIIRAVLFNICCSNLQHYFVDFVLNFNFIRIN